MNAVSRSMLTAALSLVAGLLTMSGATLTPEMQMAIVQNLDTVVGGLIALYGIVIGVLRAVTKTPLSGAMTKEPTTTTAESTANKQGGFIRPGMLLPLSVIALVAALMGCATSGNVDTANKRFAAFEISYKAVLSEIDYLETNSLITLSTKEKVADLLDDVNKARRSAVSYKEAGKILEAQDQLSLAASLLDALRSTMPKGGKL